MTPKRTAKNKEVTKFRLRATLPKTAQNISLYSKKAWRVTAIPITTVTLMVTIFGLWDIWLQTLPYVQPPPLSDKIDVLPFTVTNPSHFFTMYNAQIQFDLADPAPTLVNGKYHTVDARVMTNSINIPPLGYDTVSASLYTREQARTKAELMEQYAQITSSLVSLAVCYETRFWFLTFHRKTDPIWFEMSTSLGGERYWAPVAPGYADSPLGNKKSVSTDCPSRV